MALSSMHLPRGGGGGSALSQRHSARMGGCMGCGMQVGVGVKWIFTELCCKCTRQAAVAEQRYRAASTSSQARAPERPAAPAVLHRATNHPQLQGDACLLNSSCPAAWLPLSVVPVCLLMAGTNPAVCC